MRGSAPLRGLKGFDRAAFCGTPKASGRKASRHINPTPPARVEQKAAMGLPPCWVFGSAARRWLRPTLGLLPFKQPTPDQFAGIIEGEAPPFHQIVCRSQTLAVQQLLLDIVGKSGGWLRGHGPPIIASWLRRDTRMNCRAAGCFDC